MPTKQANLRRKVTTADGEVFWFFGLPAMVVVVSESPIWKSVILPPAGPSWTEGMLGGGFR